MGRKSRLKAARRDGLRPPTPKEQKRAQLKAQRRARCVPPTEDAYRRAAAAGPELLAHALAARHAARIENLGSIPQRHLEKCYRQLYYLHEISAACAQDRDGPLLIRNTDNQSPDHTVWATQSAMAAIRLVLAGQIVGAAIVVQQQLGRWTLLLAKSVGDEPGALESTDDLMARGWTRRAIETLGRQAADVLAEGHFDDADEPIAAESTATSYERIRLADGRKVCPASVYRGLSRIMDATRSVSAIRWECLDNLDPAAISLDVGAAVRCISDGLELCILNLRSAVTAIHQAHRRFNVAGNDWRNPLSAPTDGRLAQQVGMPRPQLEDTMVPSLMPALIPFTPIELATADNWTYLGGLYGRYRKEVTSPSSTALDALAEIAKLALAAHRYLRRVAAQEEHATDLTMMSHGLATQHLSARPVYILTAELAALCARWNQTRPEIATAAMLISSTLRSAYWLWLDGDDRAMGILRLTLQHAARLRAWRTNARLARQLESISIASHGDWLSAAGWRHSMRLDLALFEFAHANPESRKDAASTLYADDQRVDTDPACIRLARQDVLDQVTVVAADETMRVIAAQQCPSIARTAREMLRERGLDVLAALNETSFATRSARLPAPGEVDKAQRRVGAMSI